MPSRPPGKYCQITYFKNSSIFVMYLEQNAENIFWGKVFLFEISCVHHNGHWNAIHVKLNRDGNQLVPKKMPKVGIRMSLTST